MGGKFKIKEGSSSIGCITKKCFPFTILGEHYFPDYEAFRPEPLL